MKPYTIKQLTTTVFPLRVLKSSRPTDGNRHKLYDMETEYWANQYNKHSLKCKAAAISGHEKKTFVIMSYIQKIFLLNFWSHNSSTYRVYHEYSLFSFMPFLGQFLSNKLDIGLFFEVEGWQFVKIKLDFGNGLFHDYL